MKVHELALVWSPKPRTVTVGEPMGLEDLIDMLSRPREPEVMWLHPQQWRDIVETSPRLGHTNRVKAALVARALGTRHEGWS